jgi:hypothetical protein
VSDCKVFKNCFVRSNDFIFYEYSVCFLARIVVEVVNKIEINKKGTCTVEFTSKEKEAKVTVKLSDGDNAYKDYKDYKVDCTTNNATETVTYNYPKKATE